MLAQAGVEKIIGRAATSEEGNAIADFSVVKTLAENKKIKEIIFCQARLSYTAIIDIIQNMLKKAAFRSTQKEAQVLWE